MRVSVVRNIPVAALNINGAIDQHVDQYIGYVVNVRALRFVGVLVVPPINITLCQ